MSSKFIEFTIVYKEHKFLLPVQVNKKTKLNCISKLLNEKLDLAEDNIAITVKNINHIIFGWGCKVHSYFAKNLSEEE